MNRQMAILFDSDEYVCYAKHAKGTTLFLRDEVPEWARFFAINPLQPGTRREDKNVAKFRNILIEFDRPDLGSIAEQVDYVRAAGVPYSTLVSSGGKSLHCIISLTDYFQTYEEYKKRARQVILGLKADASCFNPSRLSRLGGAVRDNGKTQEIIEVYRRVTMPEFAKFASRFPEPGVTETGPRVPTGKKLNPPGYVTDFIVDGFLMAGGRTRTLFACAAALAECGWAPEEIHAALLPRAATLYKPGEYPEGKVEATIRDGIKRVLGGTHAV